MHEVLEVQEASCVEPWLDTQEGPVLQRHHQEVVPALSPLACCSRRSCLSYVSL